MNSFKSLLSSKKENDKSSLTLCPLLAVALHQPLFSAEPSTLALSPIFGFPKPMWFGSVLHSKVTTSSLGNQWILFIPHSYYCLLRSFLPYTLWKYILVIHLLPFGLLLNVLCLSLLFCHSFRICCHLRSGQDLLSRLGLFFPKTYPSLSSWLQTQLCNYPPHLLKSYFPQLHRVQQVYTYLIATPWPSLCLHSVAYAGGWHHYPHSWSETRASSQSPRPVSITPICPTICLILHCYVFSPGHQKLSPSPSQCFLLFFLQFALPQWSGVS